MFQLCFNGKITGSCFAIDEKHIPSARHNIYDVTADFDNNDTTEVLNASTIIASPISSLVVPAPIPVKIRLAATLRMIDPCYIREANR